MLSNAVIMEMRGTMASCGTELVEPLGRHFLLRKSLMPSHVSSMLRMVFDSSISLISSSANRCRNTRFFSELAWIETGTILR